MVEVILGIFIGLTKIIKLKKDGKNIQINF